MPEPITGDDPHRAATHYASLGLRVIPIKAGGKHPPIPAWQQAATTNPDTIDNWWTGLYRACGVGIATGAESGVWVLDVDVADDKRGDDTLAELQDAYGDLPDTVRAVTGSGGAHWFFAWPTGADIRNNQSGKLGDGLDVRANGGQVVVAPSVHPNGRRYEWEHGHAPGEVAFAEAPGWLLALLEPDEPAEAPVAPVERPAGDDDSPAAWFNDNTTWDELLTRDGWTLGHTTTDGEQRWVRPGKDARDGTSATVGHGGRDVLKVFTSSVPALEADRAYSRFGYEAAVRFGGDRSAFATELRSQMGRPDDTLDLSAFDRDHPVAGLDADTVAHGWEPVDVGAVLGADYTPPRPELGRRNDGQALFYAGRINALIGESGSGKSWISQWAIAQVLNDGGCALVVDLEDHVGSYVARLRALGVDDALIRERLVYISPERSFNDLAGAWIDALVTERGVTVAVIDSTGEAMALDGAKPNDDDDTARWFRRLPRRISRLGPAVLLLDHLPKASDAPQGFAIGSQRKRAAIDGAMYRVEVGVAPVKGKTGHLTLVCAKDRSGFYQHGAKVADVTVDDVEGRTDVAVAAPVNVERPTVLMERVSRFLETNGTTSRRQVEKEVSGKTNGKRRAIDVLVGEGWVSQDIKEGRGGGFQLSSITPFRDDSGDGLAVDNPNRAPRAPTAPPAKGARFQNPQNQTAPPAPPPSIHKAGAGARFGGLDDTSTPTEDAKRAPHQIDPDDYELF